MAKLLLHKIPNTVKTEQLHTFVPGDFRIEMKVEFVLQISQLFDEDVH
jgi:hypothetical protein